MKNFVFFTAFSLLHSIAFSQPNFANYYTPAPGASSFVYPEFDVAADGSIMGISVGTAPGANNFLLYKIDVNGNMLWQKNIFTGPLTDNTPNNVCMLSDSTLAIVINVISSANDFILIKCDLNGNVIWSKIYSSIDYIGGHLGIVPYGSGGVLVKGYAGIAFIDASGNVDNAFTLSGLFIWDITPSTTGSFTVWGGQGASDFFLLDIDANGTISNYFTYAIAGEAPANGNWVPYNLISKSPSGGTYTTMSLQSSPVTKLAVFYFDATYQPVWTKKISLASGIESRFINATNDNGCILTATAVYFPKIIKLDSTGTIDWIKTPGDFSNTWFNFDIFTVKPDTGNGWYCTLTKPNMHLIHTDSDFNGFCHYENVQYPQNIFASVTTNPATTVVIPVIFTDSTLEMTAIQENFYQYDACTDLLINSSTSINDVNTSNNNISIYPNPAWDKITVELPEEIQNGIISIFNLVGEKIKQTNFTQKDQQVIELSNLTSGMYILQVSSGKILYSKKLIIQKE